jgi:hypothetical protein
LYKQDPVLRNMTASPRSNPSCTAAARLGLNTPLAKQLERLPDLPNKPRPLWQRIVAGILLTSSLLVHTGQVLAQYQYGNGAYTPNGAYNSAPQTGYAPNGQLYLAGQPYKEPQAHIDARNVANSILYNAIVKGLSEPSASNPGFVHDTLGQIDSAASVLGGGAVRSATVIYFTTTNNIYGVGGGLNSPPPAPTPANPNQLANYNTYKDILTNAPGAGYQTVVAPPNAPNTPAVPYVNGPYLIKTADGSDAGLAAALFYNAPLSTTFEVAQSTQTPTGSSLIGGGVAANLNQDQTQVNHLAALSGGLVFASQAWLDPNNPNSNNLNFSADLGYLNRQGQVVGLNMDAANNASSSFSNDSGDASIDRQAWLRHLNQQAVTLDKREGFQIQANSLDLSGYNPTDLFRDGYDLYKYDPRNAQGASQNELLRRLQNGQLTPGSDEYNRASQIAQERYRQEYWVHLAYNTKLKFTKEDAQRQANLLQLNGVDPNELFNKGLDLYAYNPSLQPNGAAENELLRRLERGELTPGSSEYDQALQIAQERFRIAYSIYLDPPKKPKYPYWTPFGDNLAGDIGNFLYFDLVSKLAPTPKNLFQHLQTRPGHYIIDPLVASNPALYAIGKTAITAVASYYGGPYAGAGAAATWDAYFAYYMGGSDKIGRAMEIGGKTFVVSVVTSWVSQGLGGGPVWQNGAFIGIEAAIKAIAVNAVTDAVVQTITNGGSFEDNLKESFKNALINALAQVGAGEIGAYFRGEGLNALQLIAHGFVACAAAAARTGGDSNACAAAAAGAIAGELAANGLDSDIPQISIIVGQLAGAFAGALVDGNAGALIGMGAAANAVENNFLQSQLANARSNCIANQSTSFGCRVITASFAVNAYTNNEEIGNTALTHVGEPGWGSPGWQGSPGWWSEFKCNLFVNMAVQEGGALPPMINGRPATAGELANPNLVIPGWPVVVDKPKAGDILATGQGGPGYTGHTGIIAVGPNGNVTTVSASSDTTTVVSNRYGLNLDGTTKNGVVLRRYSP